MPRPIRTVLMVVLALLVLAAGSLGWWLTRALPVRAGDLPLAGLHAPVQVRYDERGVPHIQANSELDMYRALGFIHAQDRLFQMEMLRRLARGELAEILGPALLDTDRLFRTLGLRQRGLEMSRQLDRSQPAAMALLAYLDGVNQFQERERLPIEFDLLRIKPREFSPEDTFAVAGYLAFSFAAAFRTEPVLTHIRDQLGPAYLRIFQDEGLSARTIPPTSQRSNRAPALTSDAARSLGQIASLSLDATAQVKLPLLHGSNAWAVAGRRTASGKPLLAGDPHISYSLPSTWYEAHLQAPGFELYGHHLALMPFALLGHNTQFGWSLTMFQNDDVDFVAEKLHPTAPGKVWHQGQWVELQERAETIPVKGQAAVNINIRHSPHGPLITDVFRPALTQQAVALWWTFLVSDNPLLQAFYGLNRAGSLPAARTAVSQIHAPGLNVVWANANGDIAWWAAARLPRRPAGVDAGFVLDAAQGEAAKPGFLPFSDNPQAENPTQGHIVSANQRPAGPQVPAGYYNLPERARRIEAALQDPNRRWRVQDAQDLQLDTTSPYGPTLLQYMLPAVQARTPDEAALLEQLKTWDGNHDRAGSSATVFTQWIYEIARATLLDELDSTHFENLLKTRALDHALPRLLADAASPWWDDRRTSVTESRDDIMRKTWQAAIEHLSGLYGADPRRWAWGRAHTVSHGHPLGRQKPLHLVFDVGPFEVPGGREILNNFSHPLGPAPWKVSYGPSTRRVIDFAAPGQAMGINPVGQSGVLLDRHHHDQAQTFHQGGYRPQHLLPVDVLANTRSVLMLRPLR